MDDSQLSPFRQAQAAVLLEYLTMFGPSEVDDEFYGECRESGLMRRDAERAANHLHRQGLITVEKGDLCVLLTATFRGVDEACRAMGAKHLVLDFHHDGTISEREYDYGK